jgi:NAD(P)-dependent dehydrogenase (short-subunit alcohol dehydrogenase family)
VRDIRRRRPALLPTASLLAGIALAWRWPPVGGGAGWAAVALLALAAAARPLRPRIAAVCLCLCLVLTGLWLAAQQDENRRAAEAILFPAGADVVELHFIGTVLEPPERDWSGDVWLRRGRESGFACGVVCFAADGRAGYASGARRRRGVLDWKRWAE